MEKVYLILGASSDIALELLRRLDTEKAVVYATYFSDESSLKKVAGECKHLSIIPIKCDMSDEAEVCKLINEVAGRAITHIIHMAAAAFRNMRIRDWDADRVKMELEVGTLSFAKICSSILPEMSKRRFGKVVVLLTSFVIGKPPKYMADYVLSKYALLGYTKALAVEYGDKGINVNALSPSMVETKFLKNLDERVVENDALNSTMKRHVTAGEVADNIVYLCSDGSNYMNGVNLVLSGGDVMQ